MQLHQLKNTTKVRKKIKRVGRGPGSGVGKTCGRGEKGAHARAGSKKRIGYEGGQMRLHMKMPTRGFSNFRFRKELDSVNLFQIDNSFKDGDIVNLESLKKHGLISGNSKGVKILADGEITKRITIEANAFSSSARTKLQQANIQFKLSQ